MDGQLLAALHAYAAGAGSRADGAQRLATLLGADTVLFFVRDEEVGALLPAPGVARRLPGGRRFQDLLDLAAREGRAAARLDADDVTALRAADGTILAAFGGELRAHVVEEAIALVPLVACALRAEWARIAAQGTASDAVRNAQQAQTAARVLGSVQQELRRSLSALESRDEQKDRFLAVLGHELRNPLAVVLHGLENVPANVRELPALRAVERNARVLNRLLDDLLDVARITKGRLQLRPEATQVAKLLQHSVESCARELRRRRHELVVELPDAEQAGLLDAVRVEQIVTNVLRNAILFTPDCGHLSLVARVEEGELRIRVRDDGIGMEPGQLGRVGEPFVRATLEDHGPRLEPGLGVGLTLARDLANLHGGSLKVDSAGRGKGTQVEIVLPWHPAQHSGAAPPEPSKTRARILIVDDNEDAAMLLAEFLQSRGHEIAVAHNGLKALEIAQQFRPQIGLLDLGLPGLSGWELAERLRSQLDAHLPLVAITGYGQEQDRARSAKAGFALHLVKPASLEDVERAVAVLTRHR